MNDSSPSNRNKNKSTQDLPPRKKNISDISDISHSQSKTQITTTEKPEKNNPNAEDKKASFISDNNVSKDVESPRQKQRVSKSPTLNTKRDKSKTNVSGNNFKSSKRRVTFNEKKFLDIVIVESYKKFNIDMSINDPQVEETTRCRCLIM